MAIRNLSGLTARAVVTPVTDLGAARRRRKDPSGTAPDAAGQVPDAGPERAPADDARSADDAAKPKAQRGRHTTDISV